MQKTVQQEKIKEEEIFSSKEIFKKRAQKYSSIMIPQDLKGEKQFQSSQRKRKPKVIEEASKNQKVKKAAAKSQQKQKNKQIISREQLVQNEEVNIGQQKTYEITNYQADFMKMFKKYNLGSLETELQQQLSKKKPMVSSSFHQIYLGTVQSIQNERSKQQQQAGIVRPIEEKMQQSENMDQLFESVKKKHKTLEKVQEYLFKSYDHQEENLEKIDSNLKDMKPDTMCKIIDDIIIKNPANQTLKQLKSQNSIQNELSQSTQDQILKRKLIGLEGGLEKAFKELENNITDQKINKRDYFNRQLSKFDIQNPDIIIDQNALIPNSQEKLAQVQEFLQNGNNYEDLYKAPIKKNNMNQNTNPIQELINTQPIQQATEITPVKIVPFKVTSLDKVEFPNVLQSNMSIPPFNTFQQSQPQQAIQQLQTQTQIKTQTVNFKNDQSFVSLGDPTFSTSY